MLTDSLLLSDIQTTDLIYYDPDIETECLKFCDDRDIDCLPSLDDPRKYFKASEKTLKDLPLEQIADSRTPIFDPILIKRFITYKLLFVNTNNQLSGVVHFSDFNKPVVHSYLYNVISAYERSLRSFLRKKGLTDQQMLQVLNIKEKETRIKTFGKAKPLSFQWCGLNDLIQFTNKEGGIKVRDDMNRLRNAVMHSHELVYKDDPDSDLYIYTVESFIEFTEFVQDLLRDFKRVSNRIALYHPQETE